MTKTLPADDLAPNLWITLRERLNPEGCPIDPERFEGDPQVGGQVVGVEGLGQGQVLPGVFARGDESKSGEMPEIAGHPAMIAGTGIGLGGYVFLQAGGC